MEFRNLQKNNFDMITCDAEEIQYTLNEKQMEKIYKDIGYIFKNPNLLINAFTRKSAFSNKTDRILNSYERLEYLGDSIIKFMISEYLFEQFPFNTEGDLTKKRNLLESNKFLSEISNSLNLCGYVNAGELESNMILNFKLQADLFESLIGAIFIDSDKNFSFIRTIIEKFLFSKFLNEEDFNIENSKNFYKIKNNNYSNSNIKIQKNYGENLIYIKDSKPRNIVFQNDNNINIQNNQDENNHNCDNILINKIISEKVDVFNKRKINKKNKNDNIDGDSVYSHNIIEKRIKSNKFVLNNKYQNNEPILYDHLIAEECSKNFGDYINLSNKNTAKKSKNKNKKKKIEVENIGMDLAIKIEENQVFNNQHEFSFSIFHNLLKIVDLVQSNELFNISEIFNRQKEKNENYNLIKNVLKEYLFEFAYFYREKIEINHPLYNFKNNMKLVKNSVKESQLTENLVLRMKYYLKTNKFEKFKEMLESNQKLTELINISSKDLKDNIISLEIKLVYARYLSKQLKTSEPLKIYNDLLSYYLDFMDIYSINYTGFNQHRLLIVMDLLYKISKIFLHMKDDINYFHYYGLLLNLIEFFEEKFIRNQKFGSLDVDLKYYLIKRKYKRITLMYNYTFNISDHNINFNLIKEILEIDKKYLAFTKYCVKDIMLLQKYLFSVLFI